MNQVTVTLPDGSSRTLPAGARIREVAESISPRLAKAALAGLVDGTLVDQGTWGAAELFASALVGNQRADLVGEHTTGRAATQRLVKLPDGTGLWLSTARYLTPSGTPLHEKGLEPTVGVDAPDPVEFGQAPPPGDPILDKAIERLATKKAA